MLKIEVLGPGCAKCKALEKNVGIAIQLSGVSAEVAKVEQIQEIIARGIMMTPALVINGRTVSSGHILSPLQVRKLLEESLSKES